MSCGPRIHILSIAFHTLYFKLLRSGLRLAVQQCLLIKWVSIVALVFRLQEMQVVKLATCYILCGCGSIGYCSN